MRFNGKDFADFGVHVDESKAFGSPEKDYELVEIMGRNGNLSIYNDRFKDITLPFPCFIRTGFIEKYRSLLAYLNSQTGYQRLETDKEPNHFRKALFQGIVDPQTTAFNHGGFFTVNLLAHPQRFLKSGEIPVSASSQSVSYEGNPVSIDNPSGISAVSSLAVALNPQQNLNGYDSPWVGGGGKNIFNGQFAYHNADKYSPVVSGNTYTVSSKSTGAHQINMQYITNTNTYYGDSKIVSEGDTFGKTTVTIPTDVKGVLIYVNGDASNSQHTAYDTQIEEGNTATSYAPYENICPITGHTSASVTRTGKNLLQINNNVNTYTHNGVTYTFARDSQGNLLSITADGTATGGNSFVVFSVLPNMQYLVGLGKPIKLSGASNEGGRARLQWWNYNGNGATAGDNGNGSSAFIPTSTAGNIAIQVYNNETVHNAVYKPMILLADETDRTYEPYQGQTYTIDLNGERYGGSVNLATGVLTVDTKFMTFNGSEAWDTINIGFRCALTDRGVTRSAKQKSNWLTGTTASEPDPTTTRNYKFNCGSLINVGGIASSLAEFKSLLASNPLQIVYELATPTTVQLTAQQISLLTGINYISSSDEVTVTVSEPSLLENPTLFESKPLIRVYGHGTLTINNQYITIAENPYVYIDIDCDIMDAFYGANNANQYVTLPNDYITLHSGNNYIAYDGTCEITPRWYEV